MTHIELMMILDEITDFAGTQDAPMCQLHAAARIIKREREQNALLRAHFDAEVKRVVAGFRICHD